MTEPATTDRPGPVASEMKRRLDAALAPTSCALIDESALHQGHAGHDGRGELHFRLEIESSAFAGHSRVARQRMIYSALGELMRERVHALSIKARAPDEA